MDNITNLKLVQFLLIYSKYKRETFLRHGVFTVYNSIHIDILFFIRLLHQTFQMHISSV